MADANTQGTEGTTNTPQGEGTAQTGSADQSGTSTFVPITSQEEFDERIKARIARVKATPPADYEDLKAKAAKWDEAQEASKSELEKAQGKAQKSAKEAADWKAKFEALQAEHERSGQVAAMAAKYGVDADLLAMMSGDVEEAAKLLKAKDDARPKFGSMHDGGEQTPPVESLDEALKKAKNADERIKIRAQYRAQHRQ